MKVSVKDTGVCRKTISIKIPADTIGDERAETLKVYSKHADIPGFRKGKAPQHIVAKKYAHEIQTAEFGFGLQDHIDRFHKFITQFVGHMNQCFCLLSQRLFGNGQHRGWYFFIVQIKNFI